MLVVPVLLWVNFVAKPSKSGPVLKPFRNLFRLEFCRTVEFDSPGKRIFKGASFSQSRPHGELVGAQPFVKNRIPMAMHGKVECFGTTKLP